METPEVDPKKIINKLKDSQKGYSTILPGTPGVLHDSTFKTRVAISNSTLLPSVEVSKSLDFENFPIEYSSFRTKLKEEIFETLSSPDVVSWFRLENLEDFLTLGLPTPPSNKVVVTKEEETYFPLKLKPSSSKNQTLPLSPKIQVAFVFVKTPSPPCSPITHNPMGGANVSRNRMDSIVM
jgi:hypothetical protein